MAEDMIRAWVPDECWEMAQPLIPMPAKRPQGGGKRRAEVRHRGTGSTSPREGVESSRRLCRRRWVVEACLSWLLRNRRLARRYDRKAEQFQALADLACTLLAYRRLAKASHR